MIAINNPIEEKILSIIGRTTGLNMEELSEKQEASIAFDLGIDSLDKIEIINSIEESFRLMIPDEVIKKFDTIAAIVDYVFEHGRV